MNHRLALYLALTAALLPMLALLPLGALWLYQQGWLMAWLLLAAALGGVTYGVAWWLGRQEQVETEDAGPISGPNPDFSPLDEAAWNSVEALARDVDADIIFDRGRMLDVARETIDAVAQHYHPQRPHPVWHFTLPELFLLSERVSGRLRKVLLDQVPGSHIVRVGDAVRLWTYKPLAVRGARVFRGLNMVWRVTRLVNPGSALLAEARERLVGAALGDAGTWLKHRGARLWVEEVGRAAIEIYSGRLSVDAAAMAAADEGPPGLTETPPPGPVRILVAGQTNAGKSSLVNVLLEQRAAGVDALPLTAATETHQLVRKGEVEALLMDSPGLASEADVEAVVALAFEADALLWVTAGHRADRALDRLALDAIRDRFAAEPRRRQPPLWVVVTHLDRLSPAREWAPPYDLNAPEGAKAKVMRAALDSIAADLAVAPERLLPVRLQNEAQRYNTELLWPAVLADLAVAERARALRLALSADSRRWRQLLEQARQAGRTLWREAGS